MEDGEGVEVKVVWVSLASWILDVLGVSMISESGEEGSSNSSSRKRFVIVQQDGNEKSDKKRGKLLFYLKNTQGSFSLLLDFLVYLLDDEFGPQSSPIYSPNTLSKIFNE